MAALDSDFFHSYDYDDNFHESLTMQWHLTAACDQRCKHCYMFNSDNYLSQRERQLSTENAYQLIDEYAELCLLLNTDGKINLTGGDPILSDNFWDVLDYVHKYDGLVTLDTIMGNPFHIDQSTAKKLKSSGIMRYQISLDGLESTHDSIRKKGSFQESLRALNDLHNAGIHCAVMATVHKDNCNEILELYKFLKPLNYVDSFAFDRMIPIGNARKEIGNNNTVSADAYRNLLLSILEYEVTSGGKNKLIYKDKLWKPLFYELGLTDPLPDNTTRFFGTCPAGTSALCVLADGEVYACRRLDLAAGRFPEKSLKELFFHSELYRTLRNDRDSSKCSTCDLFHYCYGCPAMKFAKHDDLLNYDPTCWRLK